MVSPPPSQKKYFKREELFNWIADYCRNPIINTDFQLAMNAMCPVLYEKQTQAPVSRAKLFAMETYGLEIFFVKQPRTMHRNQIFPVVESVVGVRMNYFCRLYFQNIVMQLWFVEDLSNEERIIYTLLSEWAFGHARENRNITKEEINEIVKTLIPRIEEILRKENVQNIVIEDYSDKESIHQEWIKWTELAQKLRERIENIVP